MEAYRFKSLLKSVNLWPSILPFFGHIDESGCVLRSLCSKTRQIWDSNLTSITRVILKNKKFRKILVFDQGYTRDVDSWLREKNLLEYFSVRVIVKQKVEIMRISKLFGDVKEFNPGAFDLIHFEINTSISSLMNPTPSQLEVNSKIDDFIELYKSHRLELSAISPSDLKEVRYIDRHSGYYGWEIGKHYDFLTERACNKNELKTILKFYCNGGDYIGGNFTEQFNWMIDFLHRNNNLTTLSIRKGGYGKEQNCNKAIASFCLKEPESGMMEIPTQINTMIGEQFTNK